LHECLRYAASLVALRLSVRGWRRAPGRPGVLRGNFAALTINLVWKTFSYLNKTRAAFPSQILRDFHVYDLWGEAMLAEI
jgi:hypothetical protein